MSDQAQPVASGSDSDGQLAVIVQTISRIGTIATLDPDHDFYDAGFVSVNALPLLMELEDCFGVTIPDDLYIQARTARALHQLVDSLRT